MDHRPPRPGGTTATIPLLSGFLFCLHLHLIVLLLSLSPPPGGLCRGDVRPLLLCPGPHPHLRGRARLVLHPGPGGGQGGQAGGARDHADVAQLLQSKYILWDWKEDGPGGVLMAISCEVLHL